MEISAGGVGRSSPPMTQTILFIETDRERQKRIRAAFERAKAGARVDFAPTPSAGLEVVKREAVDAVFLNRAESGMEVYEFQRRLESLNRQVPVILMVAAADDATVVRSLHDGAADCVADDAASCDSYPAVALRAVARFEAGHESAERDRAILRSHKQWMAIIDADADALFVLDAGGTIVKANKAFAAMAGKHPRDLVGRPLAEVFDLALPEGDRQLRPGERGPLSFEQQIGTEVYRVTIVPLLDEGRVLTVHTVRNMTTERRLRDLALRSANAALAGKLVPGVLHELNNGLAGAIAYAELLEMKVDDAGVKADVQKVLGCADRCRTISENLHLLARDRAPSKGLASVNDVIDRAVSLRAYWLKVHNVRIEREYDDHAVVSGNAPDLERAMVQLLLNAEEAIAQAGGGAGVVRFGTAYDGGRRQVLITIQDNGPGVPEGLGDRIFEPFCTTKPDAAGLGLAIVRTVVEEHGGSVRRDPVAQGASFTIILPLGSVEAPGS